jgi:hypothetical protein
MDNYIVNKAIFPCFMASSSKPEPKGANLRGFLRLFSYLKIWLISCLGTVIPQGRFLATLYSVLRKGFGLRFTAHLASIRPFIDDILENGLIK